MRRIAWLGIVLVGLTALPGWAGVLDGVSDARWFVSPAGDQAVFIGEPGTAVTLPLPIADLRGRQTLLRLQTDAAVAELRTVASRLRLRLPAGGGTLELDDAGSVPQLRVAGEEQVEARGAWIRMCHVDQDVVVELTLQGATHATVHLGEAPPPPKPAAGSTGGQDMVAMLDAARAAVGSVRSGDGRSRGTRAGVGVRLADEGWIITRQHVLAGHASAVFTADGGEARPVQVWAVKPELDLALLRAVDAGSPSDVPAAAGLTLAEAEPAVGDRVWIITPGPVLRATVQAADLGDALGVTLGGYAGAARWLALDQPVELAAAGSPVLDDAGRVVGLTTFAWQPAGGRSLALAVGHLQALVASAGDAALSHLPVTAADLGQVPRLAPTAESSAMRARLAAAELLAYANCALCDGSGTYHRKVKVGMTGTTSFQRPVHELRETPCPRCEGSGLIGPEGLRGLIHRVADAAAVVPTDDPHLAEAFAQVRLCLRQFLADDVRREGLLEALQELGAWSVQRSEPGTPLVLSGMPAEESSAALAGSGGHLVRSPGLERPILVIDPTLVDASAGEPVLVGGRYAGECRLPTGETAIVLQAGFLLSDPSLPGAPMQLVTPVDPAEDLP